MAPGRAGERVVEVSLEAGEAEVVAAEEAQERGADVALRVVALVGAGEGDAGQVQVSRSRAPTLYSRPVANSSIGSRVGSTRRL